MHSSSDILEAPHARTLHIVSKVLWRVVSFSGKISYNPIRISSMHAAIKYIFSQIESKHVCIINVWGYTEILPPKLLVVVAPVHPFPKQRACSQAILQSKPNAFLTFLLPSPSPLSTRTHILAGYVNLVRLPFSENPWDHVSNNREAKMSPWRRKRECQKNNPFK